MRNNKIVVEIIGTPNHGARTFTIRKYHNGKRVVTYRTGRLDKEEFQSCTHHATQDWANYLQYSNNYYVVR